MKDVKVLCLHKITDEKFPSWPGMSLKTFERLLRYINRNYTVIFPNQIDEKYKKPKLILTFDDGFEDFYLNAFPLLKKQNIPAVLNVVAKSISEGYVIWTQQLNDIIDSYIKNNQKICVDIDNFKISKHISENEAEKQTLNLFLKLIEVDEERRISFISKLKEDLKGKLVSTKMMDKNQLKDVSNAGFAIGCHSMSHSILNKVKMHDNELKYEIENSRTLIQNIIEKEIDIFTFPNGLYSEYSVKYVQKAGYKYIMLGTTSNLPICEDNNVKILGRTLIYSNNHYKNIFRIKNLHNLL